MSSTSIREHFGYVTGRCRAPVWRSREQPDMRSRVRGDSADGRSFPDPLRALSGGVCMESAGWGRSPDSLETQLDSLRECLVPATLNAGLLARHYLAAVMSMSVG